MVRQTARIIFVEALGIIIIFLIVVAGALAVRLAAGPMSLGFAKTDIEDAMAKARDGRTVKLGDISLQWLSSERRAIVVATDFDVFDDSGEIVAKADRVEILLDVNALVRGRIEPLGLVLDQGWITVQQAAGHWNIAGDPIGGNAPVREVENEDADWLKVAEMALEGVLTTLRDDAGGLALRTIQFSDFDLIFEDENASEIARLEEAYGDLNRGPGGIEILIGGTNVAVPDAPGRFTIALKAPADYTQIEAEFGFLDWSLQSVFDWVPAYSGAVEGFASDASLAFRVSDANGLEDLQFGLQADAGRVLALEAPFDISVLSLGGGYTLETDRLTLEIGELDWAWGSGPVNVTIEDALHGEGAKAFSLSSDNMIVDLSAYFEDTWALKAVRAEGTASLESRSVVLDEFAFSYGEGENVTTVTASGHFSAVDERMSGELPVEAKLTAGLSGRLDVADLLRFWPIRQGKGARSFVADKVTSGTVTQADLTLEVSRDSNAEGHLVDDAIEVLFVGENVSAQPLPDVPLVQNAAISGRITGNSAKIDFTDGTLGEWQLSGGSVHYPQLAPAGVGMTLTAAGRGPARNLVQIISDSRLQLKARSGFDPETVSGDATIELELHRPGIPNAPLSSIRYQGTGQLTEGGLDNVFAGLALSDSAAQIEFDNTGLRVFGDGILQNASLSYDWRLSLGADAPPAEIFVSSVVTPDLLNHLGVSGRAYMTGNVPVDIQGTLRGSQFQKASIDFDFHEARLDIAELSWTKPIGDAAIAHVSYERSVEEAVSARVNFNAADASLEAAISLAEDGKLIGADIDSAKLTDRFDVSGIAVRTPAGGLRFDVTGDLLDLSQLLPSFAEIGNAGSSSKTAGFGEITLAADIANLVIGREIDLSDAQLELAAAEDGLRTIEIQGKLANGSALTAAYDASGLGDPAFIVSSEDAGFLPNFLFGSELLKGGGLELTGTIGQNGLPTQVHVVITDSRLTEAPVIAQILSIASLRGLSDTLSGDGILFTSIDVPLSIQNGRYNVVGAKASGPALGLTAKGWINPMTGGIDVNGVIVPSFGANSALGGLPLIGDLFVSHEGEGVFSLRYGVEGTLERAQVSVNPLSAITPGVLRRIFESPETTELPLLDIPETKPDE